MTKFLNLIKKQKKTILFSLAVAGLSITLAFSIGLVFAWTEPGSDPPDGNVDAPINVSSGAQTKAGDLTVGDNSGTDLTVQENLQVNGNIELEDDRNITGLNIVEGYNDLRLYGNPGGTAIIYLDGPANVIGNLTVSTQVASPEYCIAADCITSWPSGGGVDCPDCDSRFVNVGGDTMTGDLTVSTQITSPKYCIDGNCITDWGGAGGLTCASCDAQGNLKITTDKKLILEANDGEIYRAGGNITFQADDQWQWYSSWGMQNEMVLNYETGLTIKGDLTLQSDSGSGETGKITAPGGIDPPYISFSAESHESIKEFAKSVEEHEKVMQFWNEGAHRLEVYVINEDKFYTITGELIE